MAVARNALIRKIYDSCISAVFVVMFSKIAALVENAFPKRGALDVCRAILDVVAEVENHRTYSVI